MKKLLALLLCMAMLLSLAACDGNVDPTEPPPNGISDEEIANNNSTGQEPEEKELELSALKKFTYDADGNLVDYKYYYGNTEELSTYTYDKAGNQLTSKLVINDEEKESSAYTYDEDGNLTLEEVYDGKGKVRTASYVYDAEGQVVSDSVWENGKTTEGVYTYDAYGLNTEIVYQVDGVETERYVNQYNEDGQLLLGAFYQNSVEVFHTEYTYDENGNTTLMEQYSDGELAYRNVYAYNENGDMIEDAYYTGDGDIIYRYLMEYTYHSGDRTKEISTYENNDPESTSGGTLISVVSYSESGSLLSEATYEEGQLADQAFYTYDDSGNIVEEKYLWYIAEGEYEENRTEYSYNDDGQKLTETYYERGQQTLRDEFTYGDTGLETVHLRYENGVQSFREVSEYDESGNLIQWERYTAE